MIMHEDEGLWKLVQFDFFSRIASGTPKTSCGFILWCSELEKIDLVEKKTRFDQKKIFFHFKQFLSFKKDLKLGSSNV